MGFHKLCHPWSAVLLLCFSALILYAESEKADELSLQLGNLLRELETTQQQKVKETLAGQGTVQACYGKGVGEETAQRSCVGQGGGENVQGCCVGQGGRGNTQGCCRDQGSNDCKVNAESERMTNENLHDQSHIEEQANCTRSNQSDEDHCQTHDYAGRCCDKGHLTTYAPSPTLTELWTRCSDIARQLGLSEEDLREIRKLTGAIIVCWIWIAGIKRRWTNKRF